MALPLPQLDGGRPPKQNALFPLARGRGAGGGRAGRGSEAGGGPAPADGHRCARPRRSSDRRANRVTPPTPKIQLKFLEICLTQPGLSNSPQFNRLGMLASTVQFPGLQPSEFASPPIQLGTNSRRVASDSPLFC